MASIIETGVDYSRIGDAKYMKSYIMRLNDDLRYMLSNIDPEDNFGPEGLSFYQQTDEYIAEGEQGIDEFRISFKDVSNEIETGLAQQADKIALYVSTGDVTNQINISSDKIRIDAKRLHVYADNFYVDDDEMRVSGTIIANAGAMGGFAIARDENGNEYLEGGAGSSIHSGSVIGAKGKFGRLTCHGNLVMEQNAIYMWNCRIASTGLTFDSGFFAGNVDIAKYNEERGEYTSWYALTCKESINVAGDIHVGKNGDDSGTVRVLSVYSYFEGAEQPEETADETSDRRLKKDIMELDRMRAVELIKESRPVTYRLIDDDILQLGVIAQEVKGLEEHCGPFGIVSDDGEYLTVNYMRYLPLITAAVQQTEEELAKWRSLKAG